MQNTYFSSLCWNAIRFKGHDRVLSVSYTLEPVEE
jgi:hypothetical protein